jgi:hypothetical protein
MKRLHHLPQGDLKTIVPKLTGLFNKIHLIIENQVSAKEVNSNQEIRQLVTLISFPKIVGQLNAEIRLL